jgi:hypothetical protein
MQAPSKTSEEDIAITSALLNGLGKPQDTTQGVVGSYHGLQPELRCRRKIVKWIWDTTISIIGYILYSMY